MATYFFSKGKEILEDYGLKTMMNIIKVKSTSENLKEKLENLNIKASDVEKEITMAEQSGNKKRKRETGNWLLEVENVKGECSRFENEGFIKGIFGGCRAIKLREKVCELLEQRQQFGDQLVLDDDSSRALPATKLVGEAFGDNFNLIRKCLEIDKVRSIGIHGMGGVGKSTLVTHIYNHLVERKECVLWITVSQGCDIKMLQNKIARELSLNLLDEDDERKRAGALKHTLSMKKNFALILDDVWEYIDLVEVGVPISVEGCQWIITSRSLKVCQEMDCRDNIVVKPLQDNEGWELFLEKLGRDASLALDQDPQVKEVAKNMVSICDGLPLGIITVAGTMSGVTDIQGWRYLLGELEASVRRNENMDNEVSERMEEKVFKVLKYSFDQLNPKDRSCFLYCSLYPEDWRIPREELVKKFISEELVDVRKSRKTQFDEGHSILNRLVKVSLLESASSSYFGECVKMHDLVRVMTLKITKDKVMVTTSRDYPLEIPDEKKWTINLEKVSLMWTGIKEIPHELSPNCPKLSTLFMQNNSFLESIPPSFFLRLCGLCTLDLSGHTQITELPSSVFDLENLKALLLGHCRNLTHVSSLKKLKALRELDLSHTSIKEVPEGMEELINLRFLSMKGSYGLSGKSIELKSPCLQLLRLPFRMQSEVVAGVDRLEDFEGQLKYIRDFNRLAGSKYCIVVEGSIDSFSFTKYPENGYDGKNKLSVFKYNLKNIEENNVTISAQYIHHLEFSVCEGLSNNLLDNLVNPSSLEKLKISNSKGIECILTYDQFVVPIESEPAFQVLKHIELTKLEDCMGVIYKGVIQVATLAPTPVHVPASPPPRAAFSSLRRLIIRECNKIKKLGLPISVFQTLERISISKCKEIQEIIEVDADNNDLVISLHNLKHLSLVDLSSLESFSSAPVICNLIETTKFKNCPRLQEPSINRGTPDSYKPLYAGTGLFKKKKWWRYAAR